MQAGTATSIALAICTCDRPNGLRSLLSELLVTDTSLLTCIVLVDNHEQQAGLRIGESLAPLFGGKLVLTHESQKGIAHARNRAIKEALAYRADFVLFIDDDEVPSPNWVREIVKVQESTGAAVVGGPVLPLFDEAPSKWANNSSFYEQKQPAEGAYPRINSTANVLISLAALSSIGSDPFDAEFGLSGGSDQVLFTNLANRGFRMAWAQRAVVFEEVPAERLESSWVLQRAYRNGNINARADILFDPNLSTLRGVLRARLRAYAALLASFLGSTLFRFDRDKSFSCLIMRKKALGRLAALRGIVYLEYAGRHRRSGQ